jgi:hypothetical protein
MRFVCGVMIAQTIEMWGVCLAKDEVQIGNVRRTNDQVHEVCVCAEIEK